jgi:hypothetical protein
MAHDQGFKNLILDYPQQALPARQGTRRIASAGRSYGMGALVGATCGRDQGLARAECQTPGRRT